VSLKQYQEFSKRVVEQMRKRRLELGLSQTELAEEIGMSRSAITMIESGQRHPTLFVSAAIASHLGVRLSSVISRVERDRR
jgi:transcriptional regulator with XRE-family HTH domain